MAQYDLYDFPEYSDRLSDRNAAILEMIAQEVLAVRHVPDTRVRVSISGHSDVALRIPVRERAAFEKDVSIRRAHAARDRLGDLLVRAEGGGSLDGVEITATGEGSSLRIHRQPANEAQRRRNRRILIDVQHETGALPPAPPPRPAPDPEPTDDPDIVHAGRNFRIKLMEGVSSGSPLAPFTYTFVVWDTDNNRAAVYGYHGALLQGGGPSSPFSGESDWASFTTGEPLRVDQLGGAATHSNATLPLSVMALNLPARPGILLFAGIGIGFLSVQTGAGVFTFEAGSIRVFKGD